ncbi:hypothetical protein LVJ94_02715 [Pendulispora rubella]|uniref:Uncharacterized protein n=1 Tax=Pendulispora rubella TaxID=2741070 RepID=A0ABZ2L5F4_9BACT
MRGQLFDEKLATLQNVQRWRDVQTLTGGRNGDQQKSHDINHLRRIAREAGQRLDQRGDPQYAARTIRNGEEQDAFVALFDSDPRALPATRLAMTFTPAFFNAAAKRVPGSRRDLANASGFGDYYHLCIGAAYCNVFTCDVPTVKLLGDARVGLGWPAPISLLDGAEMFVEKLIATWPC